MYAFISAKAVQKWLEVKKHNAHGQVSELTDGDSAASVNESHQYVAVL